MRNLIQYPITSAEIATYLQELEDSLSYENTKLLGDMRPLLLSAAKIAVLTNERLLMKIESYEADEPYYTGLREKVRQQEDLIRDLRAELRAKAA